MVLKRTLFVLALCLSLAWPATAADNAALGRGAAALPARPIVVDHTSVALFEQIPPTYLTAAQAMTMFYTDRSVGSNLNDGLSCLASPHATAANHCKRYIHRDPAYNTTPADVYWPGVYPRNNWAFVYCTALDCTFGQYAATPVQAFGYFPSYLEAPDLWDTFFVNNPSGEDIYDLAAFEVAHPETALIYFTSSLNRGEVEETRRFNDQMRAWTAANGRILLDAADILSHTPDGRPCYDNRDGVAYYASDTLWENHPDDGINTPAICPQYTTEIDGGHLGSVSAGKIRLAKAYWVLMAQLAGWQPGSTVLPTATPTSLPTATPVPTEPVEPTPTDLPTATPTDVPTVAPTDLPTATPADLPTATPTDLPTATPTDLPTATPTDSPTATPPAIGLVARPNGLAVYSDLGRVYATSRDSNRVYILDGASLATIDYAEVGVLPWGAAVNPATAKIYVANFGDGTVTVLNAESLSPLQTIPIGPYPTFVQADPARNKVFVISYGHNALYVIDGETDTVEQAASTGGYGAWGVAFDPELNYVYVSNRDTHNVSTLDGNNGYQIIASHDIRPCGASGSPHAIAFNADTAKLYIACAPEGTVTAASIYRASADGLSPLANLPIGQGGEDGGGGVAVDAATGNAFFTNSLDDTLSVVSGISDTVIATVATGDDPFGVAVDPKRRMVYVGNRTGDSVIAIDDDFVVAPPTPTATPTVEPTATTIPTVEPTATTVPTVEPTATAIPTAEPTATAMPTAGPSPTPTVGAPAVHIGDLDGQALIATTTQWRARATILAHTGAHVPVAGAKVTGTWGDAVSTLVSCTTNTAGFCTLTKNNLTFDIVPSISFVVMGVTYAGATYDATANHDPDGDSDGTTIVIYQP